MKVCIVVPYDLAEEGGVKRHAMHVARALRAVGDEVWVIGPSSTGDVHGPFTRGFAGVFNVPSNGSDNYLGIFIRPWQIRRFLVEHRFDVVHLQEPLQPTISYYSAWQSVGAARVGTFHSFAEDESTRLRVARQFFARAIFPLVDRGIAVSLPAERYARTAWKRPLAIIPNGVPTRIYRPSVDGSLGDERERPLRLLFVGHWRDTRKGLPVLLDGYQQLRARGLRVTLDVIGQGANPTPLPGLTYHGPISSEDVLAEHYRAADVFVSPATGQESFGIVLLEAMASARAIVCSDIQGYRQVVSSDGARFVPPGNSAALADAIAAVGADPQLRKRMGVANRRRAEEYDWDLLAARVRDEYLAAIAQRHGEAAVQRHRLVEKRVAAAHNRDAVRLPS